MCYTLAHKVLRGVYMKKRKVFSLLLTCALTLTMGTNVFATTEDEIAGVQAQKQEAEAGLAQTQANISSLESKKQELENYLYELNSQYEELTESVSQLGIEAAEKEEELKIVKEELKKAQKAASEQYNAMKLRIVYIYENGGSSILERLLSCSNIAEFLNQVENVSQISKYDRDMLKKYEEIQENINTQQQLIDKESQEINALLNERAAKQQEVQALAANTSESIQTYVTQISASEEEANTLMAQINNADNNLVALMQQAEAEQAAEQAAAEENQKEDYGYDPETDTTESSSSSTSSNIIVEEEAPEDYYGESEEVSESTEDYGSSDNSESETEVSSDSSQGTYLGNFTLTGYCNCAQCCGTAGNATASGTTPTAGHTVAMAGVPFGTQLLINGTVYTVEDLGTPYGHVDIYFDNHADALNFGLQYADVYQLN